MVPPLRLSYGMLSDYSVNHWYFFLYVSPMFSDDPTRLHSSFSKSVSGVVRFTCSGTSIIVWVLDGLITQPLPLLFDLYDGLEYQCVTLTPSGFVSPEPTPLVKWCRETLLGGVEEIDLKHEESIVSLLLPPGLVGGLRGRNPLLVVSFVTPRRSPYSFVCLFPSSHRASHIIMHHRA